MEVVLLKVENYLETGIPYNNQKEDALVLDIIFQFSAFCEV